MIAMEFFAQFNGGEHNVACKKQNAYSSHSKFVVKNRLLSRTFFSVTNQKLQIHHLNKLRKLDMTRSANYPKLMAIVRPTARTHEQNS
jgi:hypothetical protein